jgi:hypothetical protein
VSQFWKLFDPDGKSKREHELPTEDELAERPRNIIDPNGIFAPGAKELFTDVPLPLKWGDALKEIEDYYGDAGDCNEDTTDSSNKNSGLQAVNHVHQTFPNTFRRLGSSSPPSRVSVLGSSSPMLGEQISSEREKPATPGRPHEETWNRNIDSDVNLCKEDSMEIQTNPSPKSSQYGPTPARIESSDSHRFADGSSQTLRSKMGMESSTHITFEHPSAVEELAVGGTYLAVTLSKPQAVSKLKPDLLPNTEPNSHEGIPTASVEFESSPTTMQHLSTKIMEKFLDLSPTGPQEETARPALTASSINTKFPDRPLDDAHDAMQHEFLFPNVPACGANKSEQRSATHQQIQVAPLKPAVPKTAGETRSKVLPLYQQEFIDVEVLPDAPPLVQDEDSPVTAPEQQHITNLTPKPKNKRPRSIARSPMQNGASTVAQDKTSTIAERERTIDSSVQQKGRKRKFDIQKQKQPAKKRNLGDVPKLSNEQLVDDFVYIPEETLEKMTVADIKRHVQNSREMRPFIHAVRKSSLIRETMKWQDRMKRLKAEKKTAHITSTASEAGALKKGQLEEHESAEEQEASAADGADSEDEFDKPTSPGPVLTRTPGSINRAPLPKINPFYAPNDEPRSSPFNDKLKEVADDARSERERAVFVTSSPISRRTRKSLTKENVATLTSTEPGNCGKSLADESVASYSSVELRKRSLRAKSVLLMHETGKSRNKNSKSKLLIDEVDDFHGLEAEKDTTNNSTTPSDISKRSTSSMGLFNVGAPPNTPMVDEDAGHDRPELQSYASSVIGKGNAASEGSMKSKRSREPQPELEVDEHAAASADTQGRKSRSVSAVPSFKSQKSLRLSEINDSNEGESRAEVGEAPTIATRKSLRYSGAGAKVNEQGDMSSAVIEAFIVAPKKSALFVDLSIDSEKSSHVSGTGVVNEGEAAEDGKEKIGQSTPPSLASTVKTRRSSRFEVDNEETDQGETVRPTSEAPSAASKTSESRSIAFRKSVRLSEQKVEH